MLLNKFPGKQIIRKVNKFGHKFLQKATFAILLSPSPQARLRGRQRKKIETYLCIISSGKRKGLFL
jgi:hypothetical protein